MDLVKIQIPGKGNNLLHNISSTGQSILQQVTLRACMVLSGNIEEMNM